MTNHYPIVLTIAGSDSCGGAGIQADIKSISATGSYAASVITALTAQNTQEVTAILNVNGEFVLQQLHSVFSDFDIRAVKIGMLFNDEIIAAVKSGLEHYKPPHIVLDPVMISKTGCALLPESVLDALKDLFFLTDLLTPNIPEAETLLQTSIGNHEAMEKAACTLGSHFRTNVLLKGGHLIDLENASDLLYSHADNTYHWFHANRVDSKNTHGTGCTLSAAIASYLAQDYPLHDAIALSKDYLYRAILAGKDLQIGKGSGPVDHFFMLNK